MQKLIDQAVAEIGTVLLGKEQHIRLALCCLIARGHLLIEDLPGMGKTTLSHALAKVLGLDYKRVQFTSDLLPSDILGTTIFDPKASTFEFLPGPVFTQLLLADEINRTTPKTQSALLEAMEEGQVTTEGVTRELPAPFFIIATQNPATQSGTYALPESQLDRFLMRISLGFPDQNAERKMLLGQSSQRKLQQLKQCLSLEQLLSIQKSVEDVHCSNNLLDYLQRLIARSRESADVAFGISPRGALALLRAAQSWAMMSGRSHVVPEDIQMVLPAVFEHRLAGSINHATDGHLLSQQLMRDVSVII